MRFYDFMTLLWGTLWGAAAGFVVYQLASSNRGAAWVLGGLAAASAAVAVYFIRIYKDKG